jgi:hypothetical protein
MQIHVRVAATTTCGFSQHFSNRSCHKDGTHHPPVLTLGFWSNNNGQAIMKSNDNFASAIAFLNSLNLRNVNGSEFNITQAGLNGYKQYRTWLLNATATNMAYMLSAQLSAMELNVLYNKVGGNALIYAPGTESAKDANNSPAVEGFATVNVVMNEANNDLYNSDPLYRMRMLDGNQQRPYYEALRTLLIGRITT